MEGALAALMGLQLWASGRAADLQWFHFGDRREVVDRYGEKRVVGAYALHLQTAWRIRNRDGILVGSADLYVAGGGDPDLDPDFNWDRQGANRRDELISALFGEDDDAQFWVTGVTADDVGGITITCGDEMVLEVFPAETYPGGEPSTSGTGRTASPAFRPAATRSEVSTARPVRRCR